VAGYFHCPFTVCRFAAPSFGVNYFYYAPRTICDQVHDRKQVNSVNFPPHWKILITGITSIHGWPIYRRLVELLPPDRLYAVRSPKMAVPDADNVSPVCITDKQGLERIRDAFKPTHVIHCGGVCDLNVCEARPQWAHAMNVGGGRTMVDFFGDIPILYISTDLVFSGNQPPPGGYAEIHQPDPVSVAGKTFAETEQVIRTCKNHCIIRLGLPLGDSVTGGKGAVDWIESRFKRNLPVTLFHDEFRSCVTCEEIGEMAIQVVVRGLRGLYHFGGEKSWSLYEIGEHVLKKGPYSPKLLTGIMRCEEKNGPPRIGDVSMNSDKLKGLMRSS